MCSICTQQIWKKTGNLHKYRLAVEKLVYIDIYFLYNTKSSAYKTSRGLCDKCRIWINYSFQLGFLQRLTHCITTINAEMMIKELQQSV